MEKRRQIDVMEAEVLRKEKELIATVNRSAEADRFKVGSCILTELSSYAHINSLGL